MAVIKLGYYDPGKKPANPHSFLKLYHTDGVLLSTDKFRDDDNNRFVEWKQGENIQKLQEFLFNAGFMTKKYNEGVFDYVTEASVRLFQEYIRTVDPGDKNFERDGKVGDGTWGKIREWPAGKKCLWHPSRASENGSHVEYNNWIDLLNTAKDHYSKSENQGPIMKAVNNLSNTKSTIKTKDWNFDKNKIHLVGVRRNESNDIGKSLNDDLFILLINGMVFKFWGSTDPKRKSDSSKEPFLVEGQHMYRFGWHRLGNLKNGTYVSYRALRPANNSQEVVVVRDRDNDDMLSSGDYANGLTYGKYINIHWTGKNKWNKFTQSAGCQVIKGDGYMNSNNEYIDLSDFTADNYTQLYQDDNLDKGAYNMLADLVVCFSNVQLDEITNKPKTPLLFYTLGNEKETLPMIKTVFGENYVLDALTAMKADGARV